MTTENTNLPAARKSTVPQTMKGLNSGAVMKLLEAMRPQITSALPKHLSPDRMLQMATTIIVRNPKIAECTTVSVIGAVMQASILGFRPVESLGQCYFVPYGGVCQFQIGYKGYIDLARRSGELKMVYAEVVRKGDEFSYEFGLEPKLIHKPNPDSAGEITHVYGVAHYKDGGYNFIVLTRADVENLRRRNASQKERPSGAWLTDYAGMAKAKAIKQLAKYMPLSDEFADAVLSDEAAITSTKAFSNEGKGINVEEYVYADTESDTAGQAEQSQGIEIADEAEEVKATPTATAPAPTVPADAPKVKPPAPVVKEAQPQAGNDMPDPPGAMIPPKKYPPIPTMPRPIFVPKEDPPAKEQPGDMFNGNEQPGDNQQ